MEFLHIVQPYGRGCYEFLKTIEASSEKKEHKCLVLASGAVIQKKNPSLLRFSFIQYLGKSSGKLGHLRHLIDLHSYLKQADVIVIHGMNYVGMNVLGLLYMHKELCEKTVWASNGLDIDEWALPEKGYKKKLYDKINRVVRARIPVMCSQTAANIPELRRLFPEKTFFETPYPMPEGWGELADACREERAERPVDPRKTMIPAEPAEDEEKPKEDQHVRALIQCGINYRAANRQAEIIEQLKRFSDYKKTVFMPAGYVIREISSSPSPQTKRLEAIKAKKDKGVCKIILNRQVPVSAYFRFLRGIDVSMLGSKLGFAPIYTLLLLRCGVKTYMPGDSCEYAYLKEQGACVHSWESIGEMEYDEFLRRDEACEFPESLKWYFDPKAVAGCWKRMYDYMKTRNRQ